MAAGFVKRITAGLMLALILTGHITKPDQLPGDVDPWKLQCLSGSMDCENGSNGDECLLLTGSVALNRRNSSRWKGSTVEEVIMAYESGWQYAKSTRDAFRTRKAPEHTVLLAKYLLLYGPICPENVVYQGTGYNGSGLYRELKNLPGQKVSEKFCFE